MRVVCLCVCVSYPLTSAHVALPWNTEAGLPGWPFRGQIWPFFKQLALKFLNIY